MRQGSDVRLDVAQAKRVCEAFSAAMEGEVPGEDIRSRTLHLQPLKFFFENSFPDGLQFHIISFITMIISNIVNALNF